MDYSIVGKSVPRLDLPEKLTGEARFTADIKLPGMLYAKMLRSPHPHARIVSVDVSRVVSMPGVHAVLTPFDAPQGRVAPDVPILDTVVRFVGDEVAAVAADDEDLAEEAMSLFQVQYDPLPFVTDAQAALREDAPPVHPGGNLVGGEPIVLTRGNVDEGFAQADRVFEETFTTQAHSGAALEPRVAVASWEEGRLTVWKASRGVFADKVGLALALDLPQDLVRVIGPHMGAGFGNKDETRLAVIAAILAQRARRPVKIEASRAEEFVAGRHRHATVTTLRVGVKTDGTVTAVHATTIMDTGAYLSSGPGVVRRAGQGALYLYRCPNVRYDGYLTYTNQPPAGSYRALGAPQGHFALEVLMD
ncbi:MAG: molybdopterin-dependent oxidoreductase, partial [Chloroflexi bacterium]|nr:molybdopterin-dependent oxidoreductase [Chloroflexota bacterium]